MIRPAAYADRGPSKSELLIFLLMLLVFLYVQLTGQPLQTETGLRYGVKYRVSVVRVVDGDTIDVVLPNGTKERVRMLGVDTPEKSEGANRIYEYDDITNTTCLAVWGKEAAEFTEENLMGREIYIELDPRAGKRGYYGRLLAYVYLPNGTDFTAALVRYGYARVYNEGSFLKKQEYEAYQAEAIREGRGLWGACAPHG